MELKEMIKKRQVSNFEIINKIVMYLTKYPDTRFHQALINLGISEVGRDQFYEESVTTLERMIEDENSRKS
mgnify:FL=1